MNHRTPLQLPTEEEILVGKQGHILSAQKITPEKGQMASRSGLGHGKITLDIMFPETSMHYAAQRSFTHLLITALPDQVGSMIYPISLFQTQGHSEWVENGLHASNQINKTHIWNFSELKRKTFFSTVW